MIGSQIAVTARVMDRDGKLVASVQDNEVRLARAGRDRNFRKPDALEVMDSEGEIVLQLRFHPDRLQLQARMYGTNGRGMIAVTGPPGYTIFQPILTSSDKSVLHSIRPIFKYPSTHHLGEMVEE